MTGTSRRSRAALAALRELSPLRNTTEAGSADALVAEQLRHFSIDPESPHGRALGRLTRALYEANGAVHTLWAVSLETLGRLDRGDRIAFFNAKRFVCFQIAKILDTLQNPLRRSYQSLTGEGEFQPTRGPYPIFDNIPAIFSATPVITRTATYLYACIEWVEDAFKGKELLHEIYSRLLNPTSISLANHIVDLEAGRRAADYFAWNFNSGMAAIDGVLSHLVGRDDIILCSRNVYGGTYQLLHDWFAKPSNMNAALCWFDGYTAQDFAAALTAARSEHAERLAAGREIYVYLESPCNPHGYVLDVPMICRTAHAEGLRVICDSTVGTPLLQPLLARGDPMERPDFVVHSYTKDLAGSGTTTAGVCIGRNEDMFLPKGHEATVTGPDGRERTASWEETLFWNVYYIKGAFLDADKAFEVITGMRTLEQRLYTKCLNTVFLARALASHPGVSVHCNAVEGNPNFPLRERCLRLGLPAPMFTIDFEAADLDRAAFKRFFDRLEPAFGLQVSLGQVNTLVLCPAFTSHSELDADALAEAGIAPTTIRIAVGDEDPRLLLAHLIRAAATAFSSTAPDFVAGFPPPEDLDGLYESIYRDIHERILADRPKMTRIMAG